MIKSLITTVVLVAAVLIGSQFIPLLAAHETLALIVVVLIGLAGFFIRSLFVLLLVVAAVIAFRLFF